NGVGSNAFDGCFLVDVNEVTNKGRVVADGYLDTISRIVIRMEDFEGPNATHGGGIGAHLPASGTLPQGQRVLPQVPTTLAGWGNASIELNGQYLDDVFSGEFNFTTHFLLTDHGFTDDDTGAILARDGSPFSLDEPADVRTEDEDWEAHFVVHSHDEGQFQQQIVYRNRDDAGGAGLILSDESYFEEQYFVVAWLGGEATFEILVNGTTLVEAAQTSLTFRFFDPQGNDLASTTIAPTGMGPNGVREEVTFPTASLGTYSFTVEGPAHAASYEINATLQAPESYQLHFTWEEKDEVGPFKKFDQCARSKDRGVPSSGISTIARPPGLDLRVVALGIGGTVVAILLVIKLVVDARKIDEFRAKFGKK
ncbi:MAG TPA: hypothetical protein VGB18_00060, partial [Candidatus Thermoplasmatota archaeon]